MGAPPQVVSGVGMVRTASLGLLNGISHRQLAGPGPVAANGGRAVKVRMVMSVGGAGCAWLCGSYGTPGSR